jgi:hypothetical protein
MRQHNAFRLYACVCVCVCVYVYAPIQWVEETDQATQRDPFICMYVCVCVCVYVYAHIQWVEETDPATQRDPQLLQQPAQAAEAREPGLQTGGVAGALRILIFRRTTFFRQCRLRKAACLQVGFFF